MEDVAQWLAFSLFSHRFRHQKILKQSSSRSFEAQRKQNFPMFDQLPCWKNIKACWKRIKQRGAGFDGFYGFGCSQSFKKRCKLEAKMIL